MGKPRHYQIGSVPHNLTAEREDRVEVRLRGGVEVDERPVTAMENGRTRGLREVTYCS